MSASRQLFLAFSGKEKKRNHEDMEEDELDDSEDGRSTTSSLVLSVARESDACPPVENI